MTPLFLFAPPERGPETHEPRTQCVDDIAAVVLQSHGKNALWASVGVGFKRSNKRT